MNKGIILESKLFMYTSRMEAVYQGDMSQVESHLRDVLDHPMLRESFFDDWIIKYKKLHQSREAIILLLRYGNFTYNQIRAIISASPNIIRKIEQKYDISETYESVSDIELIEHPMNILEANLEKRGMKLV